MQTWTCEISNILSKNNNNNNNKSVNSVENIFKTFVMENVAKYKVVPRAYDKSFS